MTTFIKDPKVSSVLNRLEKLNQSQGLAIWRHVLPRWIAHRLRGQRYDVMDADFFRDKLVALSHEKCQFLYMLCRSMNARRVVEVGTYFGYSTLHLAAAVRDNVLAAGHGEPGLVIGSEIEATKAAQARKNFLEAGLSDLIDLREGDALQTLREQDRAIDFVLLDTWTPLALPSIKLLQTHMRDGALVACDNVTQAAREYAEYTQFIRDPANGFISITLPYAAGLELSMKAAR